MPRMVPVDGTRTRSDRQLQWCDPLAVQSIGWRRNFRLPSAQARAFVFVLHSAITGCGRTPLADGEWGLDTSDCGNAVIDPEEGCDDGNLVNGDGCSVKCQLEPVAVFCGTSHNCALGPNGKLICWGINEQGVLGLGDTEPRADEPSDLGRGLLPVDLGTRGQVTSMAASQFHSCAVLEGGRLKCWGGSWLGGLGLGDELTRGDEPNEMGDALPPVDLGTEQYVLQVATGRDSTCALLRGGKVKCWGDNRFGHLGLSEKRAYGTAPSDMGDALPTVDLGDGASVRQLAAARADSRMCVVLDDGSVKCWGDCSTLGELGLGDTEPRGDDPDEMGNSLPRVQLGADFKVASLAVGHNHSCVLSTAGTVKCWGSNSEGELGTGMRQTRGKTPESMGESLPLVDLGRGRRAVAVAAGYSFSCAILDHGRVKCWGANLEGQLGLGDKRERGQAAEDMGDHLPEIDLGSQRTALSLCAGSTHVCVLRDDRTIVCWGATTDGVLGEGSDGRSPNGKFAMDSTGSIGDEPNEMGDHLKAVDLYF